jgi:hypothetical protein
LGALVTVWFSSVEAVEYADANSGFHSSSITLNDHETRARFHEDEPWKCKAQEQKWLLEQYKAKSCLYGRQTTSASSVHALGRKYDKAAKAHTSEAALHRERVLQLQKMPSATSRPRPSTVEGAK